MMKEGELKQGRLLLLLNQRHVQPPPEATHPLQLERLEVLRSHLRRHDRGHLIARQIGSFQNRPSVTSWFHHPTLIIEEHHFLLPHGWTKMVLFCCRSFRALPQLDHMYQVGRNICEELQHMVAWFSVCVTTMLSQMQMLREFLRKIG